MNLKSIAYWLARPRSIIPRIGYGIRRRLRPDEPWLAPDAIAFLDRYLHSDWVGLEWGSGSSTAWFAKRLKHLTSIEQNAEWTRKVQKFIDANGVSDKVNLLYIPVDRDGHVDPLCPDGTFPPYVSIVETFKDNSLDFVLVDGHYRVHCILAVIPKLRPGGALCVDNTGWLPRGQWRVPSDWPILHHSENVVTQTTIWEKPRENASGCHS